MNASHGPPPLPWAVRTAPERWLLIGSLAVCGMAAALLVAARCWSLSWVCAWRSMTGLPCAGCGGTRAAFLLLQREWWHALALNPGVVVAAVLLVLAVLYASAVLILRVEPWRPRVRGWRWMLAAAVAANWLYLLAISRP